MKLSALTGVKLNVVSSGKLSEFYTEHLGMSARQVGEHIHLGYGGQSAELILSQSPSNQPYAYSRQDEYWKIGITLPNIDLAYDQLSAKGIPITQPRQFKDIGYLCHITDPEGFQIELLQHTFTEQPRTQEGDPDLPLGGGALIGQITLRTTNIEKDLAHYQDELGMKLLSIQPVTEFGFDLYFLGFTEDIPPNADLKAVENRPWLWQRPYTTLEIQHILNKNTDLKISSATDTGYQGLLLN